MNKNIILHLSLISGVGPATVERLIQVLSETAHEATQKNIYKWQLHDFLRVGISEKNAYALITGLADKTVLDKELSLIEEHGVNWITVFDDEYPELLNTIHLPPVVLYWFGPLTTLLPSKKAVALVGARKANAYGKKIVHMLVPSLVEAGCVTISGGAYGIDEFAHETTIKSGGKTVVVLGSGLLNLYPSGNKKLFEQVIKNGSVLLSSFPLTMNALPGNFPARNRIIAGLSHMTIVVQAAQKSGSLITARFALDQGRLVGAVPGLIDDELSQGPHKLLASGARLIGSVDDIFDELGEYQFIKKSLIDEKSSEKHEKLVKKINQEAAQLNCFVGNSVSGSVAGQVIIGDPIVYACRTPKGVDELVKELGIVETELKDRLFMLQLEGEIEQNFAGLWYKI